MELYSGFLALNSHLTYFSENVADLILCNPPFHQQHVIGDFIAQKMFKQAKTVLKKAGVLLVIGNRHLNYGALLSKIFGKDNVRLVAQNQKFQIWQATLLR